MPQVLYSKRLSLLISACMFIGARPARPQTPVASFNVKDFGAKGDGKTDDTKAIQDALDAAGKKAWSEQYPGSAYFYSSPVVLFPNGKYLLSDTIKISANMAGEGNTILSLGNKEKDILSGWAWRWRISGFTFVGGKNHLNISNANIDTGRIVIEKCAFYHSAGVAVNAVKGTNSTHISIKDCVFIGCDQAFVNWCDVATITDSWITTSATMKNKAAIENHGMMTAENICGVPAVVAENDQRWFDNYGLLTCRNYRFGGESAGFTAVVNWAPYVYKYPVEGPAVVLDSCAVYALGNPKRRAAVFCEEIPNQIIIRHCNGLPDLPMIRVSEKIDLNTYLDNAEQRPACLRFLVDNDNVETGGANKDLPEQMRPYQANEIEAEAPPKTGNWHRGAFLRNRAVEGKWTPQGYVRETRPAEKVPYGWYCVQSGKPGVWREVYWSFEPGAVPRP